jgi:hypothetical protein
MCNMQTQFIYFCEDWYLMTVEYHKICDSVKYLCISKAIIILFSWAL